jgi:phosphohistidine phosphatase SixA
MPMNSHSSRRHFSIGMAAVMAVTAMGVLCPAFSQATSVSADQPVWDALRKGGHVLLIRHTQAPGTFDPPGFVLSDCSTQRNLSEQGRAQAKRLGELIRSMRVPVGQVLSSPWCRCMDTASLAFGASHVQTHAALGSPAQLSPEQRKANADTMRNEIQKASTKPTVNRVFVTHMFNIQDITGENVAEGEILVVRDGPSGLNVVGRIPAS